MVVASGLHSFLKPCGDFGIGLAEDASVVRVCCHATETEQKSGAQRHNVLVAVEKIFRLVGFGTSVLGNLGADFVAHFRKRLGIKVHVSHAHEQSVHEQVGAVGAGSLVFQRACQCNH